MGFWIFMTVCVLIIPVERALRKNFDPYGRKNKEE